MGIDETGLRAEPRSEVSVYPNPSNGMVAIESEAEIKTIEVKIITKKRKDKPRFGGTFIGNLKILKLFAIVIMTDLMNLFLSKKNI